MRLFRYGSLFYTEKYDNTLTTMGAIIKPELNKKMFEILCSIVVKRYKTKTIKTNFLITPKNITGAT